MCFFLLMKGKEQVEGEIDLGIHSFAELHTVVEACAGVFIHTNRPFGDHDGAFYRSHHPCHHPCCS